MPEEKAGAARKTGSREMAVRHQGRGAQVLIYTGKMMRMFLYQNDWKVLPMSAVIAGLVGLVIRRRMFLTMDGTLMGSFALVCVCIWNGCFNSIQSICRERDVIKREHRSGMHISSYIVSHMLYQAMICVLQTAVTLYVTELTGVRFPEKGLFTSWLIVDMGISMMLITYAADMLSLWVSALARSSTTAMTIMPFVLIFQLVFSGGMLTIPEWAEPLTNYTISNPGLKVIAAHADLNNRPFVTISEMLDKMQNKEVNVNLTPDQIIELLQVVDNGELKDYIAAMEASPEVQEHHDEVVYSTSMTLGELMEIVGEKSVKSYLEESASQANRNPAYDCTRDNIEWYWLRLLMFTVVFALLAMVTLEFIDKDKR